MASWHVLASFVPTSGGSCFRRYRYGTILKWEIYATRNGRILIWAFGTSQDHVDYAQLTYVNNVFETILSF